MEYHATHELDVIVHHVPFDFTAGSEPFVFPNRFVAFDDHIGLVLSHFVVPIRRCDGEGLVFRKPARGFFYHSKCLWQNLHEHLLHLLIALLA